MLKPWDAVSHPASCSVFLASPKIGPSRPHFFAAPLERKLGKELLCETMFRCLKNSGET